METYCICQDRQLYQLFPDERGHVGFAIPLPSKYSRFNHKRVWDRYIEYRKNGWIASIEQMIEKKLTFEEIVKELDL